MFVYLNADKIVVGSLSGVLAVFSPSGREQQPDDQLLEVQLDHPVLQLELGHFQSSRQPSLAVLHPRSVVVYALEGAVAGGTRGGNPPYTKFETPEPKGSADSSTLRGYRRPLLGYSV